MRELFCSEGGGFWKSGKNETTESIETQPVEIVDAVYYWDGGTIGIVLKDNTGENFSFCLDGRLSVDESHRHIYIGAIYPTKPKAQKIDIGGKEEKAILKILEDWLNEKTSKEEWRKLLNVSAPSELSKEDYESYLKLQAVLSIIKKLKNR